MLDEAKLHPLELVSIQYTESISLSDFICLALVPIVGDVLNDAWRAGRQSTWEWNVSCKLKTKWLFVH
jgi:hypothetical protein